MTPTIYDRRGDNSEDWPSYQRLVLDKLEGLETSMANLKETVTGLRVEVATQKTKMSMIGAGMGLASAAAAEFIWRILGGPNK
jgi:hypothetical protein